MSVLVVIFGGADYERLQEFGCKNILQDHHGSIEVDDLYNDKDISTAIMSQFLTGKNFKKTGVEGRKKYNVPLVNKIEKEFFRKYSDYIPFEISTRKLREGLYELFLGHKGLSKRNYLGEDLKQPTLLEAVDNSRAIYVPAYNPEPSWAIRRNILDTDRFPELGREGAEDLLYKNFYWRKKQLMEGLEETQHELLIAHFQFLDSLQHLFIEYQDDWEEVEKGYEMMDGFAAEIKEKADYDKILFMSENGSYTESEGHIHRYNAFYSTNFQDLENPNMRDFYDIVLEWVS